MAELVLGGWRWSSLTTLLSVQKWHIWQKACQDERSPSWEYPGRHLHMPQKTEYSQRKWLGTAAVMPSNNMNKRWRNIHKDSSLLTNKTTVKNINHFLLDKDELVYVLNRDVQSPEFIGSKKYSILDSKNNSNSKKKKKIKLKVCTSKCF